jgi:hypothetical protein
MLFKMIKASIFIIHENLWNESGAGAALFCLPGTGTALK